MQMLRRTMMMVFGNVLVRRAGVMHMQARRLLDSRQHGETQNECQRRTHVPQ